MEYYSAIKKNEIMLLAVTWMNLESVVLSEVSWTEKRWYIYTMEYYSAIKKNEIMLFAATWMDLETVIPSEVRQKQNIV